MKQFEMLSHTADLKLRVYGTTLPELFAHACIGMFSAIGPQSELCALRNGKLVCSEFTQEHDIQVNSRDEEMLLVDFLSEALYLSDVYNEAYLSVTMHTWSNTFLHATVRGVKVTRFDLEIKAVTYNELAIQRAPIGWQVDIVFDI